MGRNRSSNRTSPGNPLDSVNWPPEGSSYHHGDLREALLELGIKALEIQGAERISLRSLADEAGVSKSAPYRHFRDKETFLSALVNEGFRILHGRMARVLVEETGQTGTVEKGGKVGNLQKIGLAYLAFVQEKPALYRLMTSDIVCRLPVEYSEWPGKAMGALMEIMGQNPQDSIAAWAFIHGLSLLNIDQLLPPDMVPTDWSGLVTYLSRLAPDTP